MSLYLWDLSFFYKIDNAFEQATFFQKLALIVSF